DGRTLFAGTKDGIVKWDPRTGKALGMLARGSANNLIFSPDGRTAADLIFARGGRGSESVICVWDLISGKPHRANDPEIGHRGEVSSVVLSRDGRTLASADMVEVRVWDVASGRTLQRIKREEQAFRSLAFAPDGKHLFVGMNTAIVKYAIDSMKAEGTFAVN